MARALGEWVGGWVGWEGPAVHPLNLDCTPRDVGGEAYVGWVLIKLTSECSSIPFRCPPVSASLLTRSIHVPSNIGRIFVCENPPALDHPAGTAAGPAPAAKA